MKRSLPAVAAIILTISPALNDTIADVESDLQRCAVLQNDNLRLACYDALAGNAREEPTPAYISPPQTFMQSQLRVRESEADFKLTVADFMALLRAAVLDNGGRIEILGWMRTDGEYTLRLNMKYPLELTFQYSARHTPHFCVLQPIKNAKFQQDPAQFIMVIASMSPP